MKKKLFFKCCVFVALNSITIYNVVGQCVNSGIGVDPASALSKLHIKGCGNTSSTSSLQLMNLDSKPLFFVRDDGNVGLNTITPTAQLQVNHLYDAVGQSLYLYQPVATWGTVPLYNSYRYIQTGALATDGQVKAFHVGPGGVTIGYPNTPVYGSGDALYINGNVGIGTAAPTNPLNIESAAEWGFLMRSSNSAAAIRNNILIQRSNAGAAVTANFTLGGVGIGGSDGTNFGSGWNGGAEMMAYATQNWTATARGTCLAFATTANGTAGDVERVRIDQNGFVGVGITTPYYKLHVTGGGANGEVAGFQNLTYETFFVNKTGTSAYNPITKANDNGIFWKDKTAVVESDNGFVIGPWAASAKGIRIDGPTGYLGVGAIAPLSRLEVFESVPLGAAVNNSKMVSTFRWMVDGNQVMKNLWIKRKTAAVSWTSAVIHDGISVDVSYLTPGTNTGLAANTGTKTWWERDPGSDIQSWGNDILTYMTLKGGKLGVGTQTPEDLLQVGAGSYKAVTGGLAASTNLGYGTSYLGFNASRQTNTWSTGTDLYNNGGGVIYGDMAGGIRFATISSVPGTPGSTAGQASIADATLAGNTKLYVRQDGNIGISTLLPQSKLEVGGSMAYKVTTITTAGNVTAGNETIILGSAPSGVIAITLPLAGSAPGRVYTFKKIYTANITIAPAVGEALEGATGAPAVQTLSVLNQKMTIVSSGNAWFIIN